MRHAQLLAQLSSIRPFERPRADLEQVPTPPEAAATLLEAALAAGDISGRTVLDLGTGTGVLAIGAALLGAGRVVGVDSDATALVRAREEAARLEVDVRFVCREVGTWPTGAETVLMNPPFGAQRRGADRPFWDRAFALAGRAIYAFALADSRTFIARRALAASTYVESVRPVPWELVRLFPHHRRARVPIPVDLWVIRREHQP
ncbi:MAG: 50S ribosomal protein L11 methyltransferase [Thermoplasmata archaeon]|jgi:putative methylase